MKKLLIFLSVTLYLSACGLPIPFINDQVNKDAGESRQFESTNPVFHSYIEEYEQKGKSATGKQNFKVNDIPVNFGDTENIAFQGVCFEYFDGKKEIIIRESWWKNVNEQYRKSLLFHELGHCHLNREHLEETLKVSDQTHKVSLMHSIVLTPKEFQSYEEEYMHELFTQDQNLLIQSFSLANSP